MRSAGFILVSLLALTGCTPAEDQHAREQAHQTSEVAKHDAEVVKNDAKQALNEVKAGTIKAGKEIDKGLQQTRDKVRKALDAPPAR